MSSKEKMNELLRGAFGYAPLEAPPSVTGAAVEVAPPSSHYGSANGGERQGRPSPSPRSMSEFLRGEYKRIRRRSRS